MSLRPPNGIRGRVPSAVSNYIDELYTEITTLSGTVNQTNSAIRNLKLPTSSSPLSPTTPASLQVAIGLGGQSVDIVVTHAQRLTTPPSGYPLGTNLFESDRHILYTVNGTVPVWQYSGGVMVDVIANRPNDLAANDAGFLFVDSTGDLPLQPANQTQYVWTGTIWVTVGGFLQLITDAVTNTITTVFLLKHLTSGAAAAGFGAGVVEQLQNSAGAAITAMYDTIAWITATAGAEDSQWEKYLIVAGVLTKMLTLANTGDFTLQVGNYLWKAGTAFTGKLTHANTGNRVYTFSDADGNIVYETAVLTNNNFLFGGGGALVKDSGFSVVPITSGGTGSGTAAGARTNLSAAQIQAPGGPHTVPLAKITGGGANGSLTFNAQGVITGFVDPT